MRAEEARDEATGAYEADRKGSFAAAIVKQLGGFEEKEKIEKMKRY